MVDVFKYKGTKAYPCIFICIFEVCLRSECNVSRNKAKKLMVHRLNNVEMKFDFNFMKSFIDQFMEVDSCKYVNNIFTLIQFEFNFYLVEI